MASTPAESLNAEWIYELLQLPTPQEQVAFLRSVDLLHADGLSQILDQAMRLARSDPGKARSLTTICADLAAPASAPAITPRATYLKAQTYAINGEFGTALDLIDAACAGYEAVGEPIEALRTNIGRMHVLNELGRHAEALDAGQVVLDAIEARYAAHPQAPLLTALAHQNLGVCFETTGRYEDALAAYGAAEELFTELHLTERVGDVSNNRGIVLTHLGRISEALAAFERAARTWSEGGLTLLEAQTLSNIGDARLALGNYTRSLEAYEQARRLFEPIDAVAHKRILLRKTADAYLALNLYPEAIAVYGEANRLLKDASMADHYARALWGLGAALVASRQFSSAADALLEAAALFEAADNTPMLSSVMLEQAGLQQAQGHSAAALQTARQAHALVAGESWPVQRVYACLRLADLLLPDIAAAERHLREAQQLADHLHLPVVSYRLVSRFGRLRLLQGRVQEAQSLLEAAAEQIEALRGDLAQEAVRTSFLRDKTDVYKDLLRSHLLSEDADSVQQAFAVAERAKSRTLVDLLTGVIAPGGDGPDDPAVTARLQELQADLNATYNQFLDASPEPGHAELSSLQARASRLEQEIGLLRLRSTGRAALDPFGRPITLNALQAQLADDTVVLAYHVLGDEILCFVVDRDEVQIVRRLSRLASTRQLLQRLNAQWDRFRAGGDFAQRHEGVLEQSARRVLAALYTELVGPLRPALRRHAARGGEGWARLAIVPHDILHQVPFQALYDGRQYLIDRFEISYAPSATVLALCQQRPRHAPKRGLIVGLADALVPAVHAEVNAVAQQLGAAGVRTQTLIDEGAHLAAVRDATPGNDVIHLACHGLFRADNPVFSALKLHDGWLTAADALRLDLRDALVTLSACESGRGAVLTGDEVIGLPRAFLGAGAATVVVSLWLVQDESTSALMADYYRSLRDGAGRAAALRSAQLSLRERFSHPYYWAPFVIIGQR